VISLRPMHTKLSWICCAVVDQRRRIIPLASTLNRDRCYRAQSAAVPPFNRRFSDDFAKGGCADFRRLFLVHRSKNYLSLARCWRGRDACSWPAQPFSFEKSIDGSRHADAQATRRSQQSRFETSTAFPNYARSPRFAREPLPARIVYRHDHLCGPRRHMPMQQTGNQCASRPATAIAARFCKATFF
jgi:hypothetical protein